MASPQNSEDEKALDLEQGAAVEADQPAVAVLAGPGSGKTRTLAYRAKALLQKDKSASALLLTFTNKAAAEMKARVLGLAAGSAKRISASTFHTFCFNVIRAHGALVGLPTEFEILDQDESDELAGEVAGSSEGREISHRISHFRLRRKALPSTLVQFFKKFQERRIKDSTLDFDDLVVGAADLFEKHPDVAAAYGAKFRHILVDEFQDTNAVQGEIVDALRTSSKTISVFADDDQSIFGFAGAEAANIHNFISVAGATVFPLTTNYRSGEDIVALANNLIKADPTTSGRLMKAHRKGGIVQARKFATLSAEAAEIAEEIGTKIHQGEAPASIAILVKRGKRADTLVDLLSSRGIPTSDWRGETHTTEERGIFAAGLATVRGTLNKRQRKRLCELLKVPLFKEPATEAFFKAYQDDDLVVGLKQARELAYAGAPPHAVAEQVQHAIAQKDADLGERLKLLVETVAQFESFDPDFTLEHLFSELALGSVGRPPAEGGGVKVASLHRTKGLQWKTVYLVGLEQGLLPDFRSTTGAQVSEERRVCFVGVSRAEDHLCMTFCKMTGGHKQEPSRFLGGMGVKLT